MTVPALKTVSVTDLVAFGTSVLEAAGAPAAAAHRVAIGLAASDACGVATHGIRVLPRYVEAIERGELDPSGLPTIERDGGAYALVSGNWTFGHVAADFATRLAVARAAAGGIAFVGLVESHHIGRLGEYVEMAAHEGVILGVWSGGQGALHPIAAPYGGRNAVLHTNPIAIGVPAEPDHPLVLDIATTAVAGSKVDMARERGRTLPPGLLLDANGDPSIDPEAYFSGGALLPFGEHKGYGFMLVTELLGRTMLGADDRGGGALGGEVLGQSGTAFTAWRCDLFIERDRFTSRAEKLFSKIRDVPAQAGFDKVRVPGDLEAEARNRTSVHGIALDPMTRGSLVTLGQRLGVPTPTGV